MSSENDPLISRQEIDASVAAERLPPAFAGTPAEARLMNERANSWARIRYQYKAEMAEMLGSFVFILFGAAGDCQVNVARVGSGFLSVNVGWAVGLALGVWICGGISGGHLNPAVTVALAVFRGFSWKKVPSYIIAQVFGAMLGALAAFANYSRQIKAIDPNLTLATSKLFHSAPGQDLSTGSLFYSELLGTAILLASILSFGDKANLAVPKGTLPFALFLLLMGIGAALGVNTSYSLNPARDLGPRLAMILVGYGHEIFTHDHLYWIWNGILAPILGACLGVFVYDSMIYSGLDSVLNAPSRKQGHIRLPDDPEARG